MNEKYLPIGSVVTLENATKKVMITGYLPIAENNVTFDYNACIFPEGILTMDKTLAFNHNQIKEINHIGLNNDEEKEFNTQLKKMINKIVNLKKIEMPETNATTIDVNQNINLESNSNKMETINLDNN